MAIDRQQTPTNRNLAESQIAQMVALRKTRPLRPFAYLEIAPPPSLEKLLKEGHSIPDQQFKLHGGEIPDLIPPIQWSGHARSFEFHLHAFRPIKQLLLAHGASSDRQLLDAALAFALDWIKENSGDVDLSNPRAAVARCLDDPHPSRWYDMAIGQRLQVLAYLYDAASRHHDIAPGLLMRLKDQILLHHQLLLHPDVFKSGNNHGFYQAITQYAAAVRLPELDPGRAFAKLARQRLVTMLKKQFGPEDVHLEHSPGYHYLLMVTLTNAQICGIFDDELAELVDRIQAVMVDMVTPDGSVVLIGDTDPRVLTNASNLDGFFGDPMLRYVVSNGRDGEPPRSGVRAYRKAGFAFARLYARDVEAKPKNASYLAQTACFHSRTHKHADHLSFVWHDRNRDILVDPGRFAYAGRTQVGSELFKQGFWYADPRRIYVESTNAHNCVEIDGANYPRNGPGGKPFGSALKYAGEQKGLAITECEVTHMRFIRHWRCLIMSPGRFLVVLDWLYNRSPQSKHDFRQWFQFHPDWQVKRDGNVVRASSPKTDERAEQSVVAASMLPDPKLSAIMHGRQEPSLQGWYSNKANSLVPAASLNFSLEGAAIAQFATVFSFGENLTVDCKKTRINQTMRTGQFAWSDDSGEQALQYSRQTDKCIQIL